MPKSMTGFARVEKEYEEGKLSGEARSLNSRYLEISIKLPRIDFFYEQKLRELVKKRVKRGKIDITMKWEKTSEQISIPKVNENTIKQYAETIKALKKSYKLKGHLTVDNIFSLRDVFVYEENNSVTEEKLVNCVETLLTELNSERAKEGQLIQEDLMARVATILSGLSEIETRWPATIKTHEEKLKGPPGNRHLHGTARYIRRDYPSERTHR
ncbi:MAG: YicC family protein [Deltaproteobacteria bacterium]|nr:YicC family protein [Deltaproteobacteria bacterium]